MPAISPRSAVRAASKSTRGHGNRNVSPSTSRRRRPTERFRIQQRKREVGGPDHQEVPGRARAIRRHTAADARAGTGRLGDEGGDRKRRRHAWHALHPGARGRDLLHPVPAQSRRKPGPCAGLRHDPLHAARFGGADRRLPAQDPSRPVRDQRGRHALLGRGRVPGRLRERADGHDLQGHLRGPDARTSGRDHRPVRGREGRGRAGRSPGRPHLFRAGGRSNDAPGRRRREGAVDRQAVREEGFRSRRRAALEGRQAGDLRPRDGSLDRDAVPGKGRWRQGGGQDRRQGGGEGERRRQDERLHVGQRDRKHRQGKRRRPGALEPDHGCRGNRQVAFRAESADGGEEESTVPTPP